MRGVVTRLAALNLLPALSEVEYAALRDDIARRGVLVPIEVDEHGRILDGWHRRRACDELGIDPPTVVRPGLSDAEKREHAIVLNLVRRQLGPVAWAQAFDRLLDARGIERRERARNDLRSAATVAAVAREVGVPARTARWRMRVADELAGHPDLAAKVDRGELPAQRALRIVREQASAAKPAPAAPTAGQGWRVVQGDVADLPAVLDRDPADAIVCDPPYGREALPLYATLGEAAARVLRPGGSLVVMVGQAHLFKVGALLAERLDYRWTLSYGLPASSARIWGRRIFVGWKPVLWFSRGEPSRGWVHDVLVSDHRDKRYHPWGQGVAGMATLVERFSDAGELVVDPFCGGGTTGVAAVRLGRRFVGVDVDPAAVETSRSRIAEEAR